MTISAISYYRGGAIDVVAPLAKSLKALYRNHGVSYRLSRVQSGPNEGDWVALVTYADAPAYETAQARFAEDEQLQGIFGEIAKFANRTSREILVDVDL